MILPALSLSQPWCEMVLDPTIAARGGAGVVVRRLDSLAVGEEFVWSGVRFRLESDVPETLSTDPRPHLAVVYLEGDSKGGEHFKAGDRGLMPAEEDLDDQGCPW